MILDFSSTSVLNHRNNLFNNLLDLDNFRDLNDLFNNFLYKNWNFYDLFYNLLNRDKFLLDNFHFLILQLNMIDDSFHLNWYFHLYYFISKHLDLHYFRYFLLNLNEFLNNRRNFNNRLNLTLEWHQSFNLSLNNQRFINWNMDYPFHLLNSLELNNFLDNLLDCYNFWDFDDSLYDLLKYFLNLDYLWSHSKCFKNIINIYCIHYFSFNHSYYSLIHLKYSTSFQSNLFELLKQGFY